MSTTTDTIETLVKTRSTAHAKTAAAREAFENAPTAHRNIEVIRTEAVYLFNLSVTTGTGKITIDCGSKLQLNPALSEAVTEQDGSFIIQLPVFKELSKRGTKLTSRRSRLQEKFLRFARPYWYVNRSDMPDLRDEICKHEYGAEEKNMGLMQLADNLRDEVFDLYDGCHTEYLVGLERVFTRAGNLDSFDIDKLLTEYDAYFPSIDKIRDRFGVLLEGPIKIPSLLEEAERSADMAEALARREGAELAEMRSGLEIQALTVEKRTMDRQEQAVKELEKYWIESIQSSFAQGIEDARDEGYVFMAAMLERMESVNASDVTRRTQDYFNKKWREMQTCLNTLESVQIDGEHPDPLLKRFAEMTRQLKVLTTSSVDQTRVQERLNLLREQMQAELSQVVTNSQTKGHRAIARWMILDEQVEQPQAQNLPARSNSLILEATEQPEDSNQQAA